MRMVFFASLIGSLEAVDFYCKAFDAELKCCYTDSTGKFVEHAEIALNDQTFLSLMEYSDTRLGNNMSFWLTFDDEKTLNKVYEVLKEGAEIQFPLSPCEWSKWMTDLTDKFGIHWLLNVF
jgi:PhnB protein